MNLVIAKLNMNGWFINWGSLIWDLTPNRRHITSAILDFWQLFSAIDWYIRLHFLTSMVQKNEPSLLSFAQGQIYLLAVSLFGYFFQIKNKCRTAITYIFWLSILLFLRDHLEVLCWILDIQISLKLQVSTNQLAWLHHVLFLFFP